MVQTARDIYRTLRVSSFKQSGRKFPYSDIYNYQHAKQANKFKNVYSITDRLCGLVVRVPGYKSRGPGFDSRSYQIFREVGGMEGGPLSLVRTIE
jgi:hypothetical protein